MTAQLHAIAEQFAQQQTILGIESLGNGLINDTFLVSTSGQSFVLQRINQQVFPAPEQVMENLQQLSQHLAKQASKLQFPAVLLTNAQQAFYRDNQQQVWRGLELISPAESREQLSNDDEAAQVGFALAHFHRLCSNLATEHLLDTLPGFHITPQYFQQYQAVINQPLSVENDPEFRFCRDFIASQADKLSILEDAKQRGELVERVIHGDPKLNNFLFQPNSQTIISLIDLDTVKPGLVHYDIGDCLRSCCHLTDSNQFDLARCQIILTSYLQEAGSFFSAADYDYLYAAIWLIPFELGLRFFNDYLQGNRYFKIQHPQHNLQRAKAQFELCADIERQEVLIKALIKQLKSLENKTDT